MLTIHKHEKFVPPVDGHNTAGQFIPSLHGFNGVVSVSLPGNNQTIDSRVLATTKQLKEFPYNQDMSGGDHSLLGIGFLQNLWQRLQLKAVCVRLRHVYLLTG